MLPQSATVQHCMQHHDVAVVQHCFASSMTAIQLAHANARSWLQWGVAVFLTVEDWQVHKSTARLCKTFSILIYSESMFHRHSAALAMQAYQKSFPAKLHKSWGLDSIKCSIRAQKLTLPGELSLSLGLWQYSRSLASVQIHTAARAPRDISKSNIDSTFHSFSRHLGSSV